MANYHVRTGQPDANAYEVLFHIPIPSANNRVGINYRTVLIDSGIGGTTRMVNGVGAGQIANGELNQITSGAIYEHVEVVSTFPGETAAQYQTRLDARYAELANTGGAFLTALRNRIEYYGHDRNVP